MNPTPGQRSPPTAKNSHSPQLLLGLQLPARLIKQPNLDMQRMESQRALQANSYVVGAVLHDDNRGDASCSNQLLQHVNSVSNREAAASERGGAFNRRR